MFIKHPDKLRELWQDRAVPIRVAVETGTFRGVSASTLSPAVDVWHTIDINPGCTALARKRCDAAGITNVRFHVGDSRKVLPRLLYKIQAPCLIMLDAHFSKVRRKLTPDEPDLVHDPHGADFPLLAELEIVAARPFADIILVDDTELFGKVRPDLRARDAQGNIIDNSPQWESMTKDKVAKALGRIKASWDLQGTTVYMRSADTEVI